MNPTRTLRPYRYALIDAVGEPLLKHWGTAVAFSNFDFAMGACGVRVLRGATCSVKDTVTGQIYDYKGNVIIEEIVYAKS